jgi:hypothetical protein
VRLWLLVDPVRALASPALRRLDCPPGAFQRAGDESSNAVGLPFIMVAFTRSSSVAPFGRRSRSRMIAFFEPSRASAAGFAGIFGPACFLMPRLRAADRVCRRGLGLCARSLAFGAFFDRLDSC